MLAVLVQCEPIAKKFGKKYGNDLANILQEVANQRVSEQFGTDPLVSNFCTVVKVSLILGLLYSRHRLVSNEDEIDNQN